MKNKQLNDSKLIFKNNNTNDLDKVESLKSFL